MNKHEALHIVVVFKEISKERKRIRRRLCRFIRENINNCCHEMDWLKSKSDRRYLGDLSDSQLEFYTKLICEGLGDK
jgi:hypothetical protein